MRKLLFLICFFSLAYPVIVKSQVNHLDSANLTTKINKAVIIDTLQKKLAELQISNILLRMKADRLEGSIEDLKGWLKRMEASNQAMRINLYELNESLKKHNHSKNKSPLNKTGIPKK